MNGIQRVKQFMIPLLIGFTLIAGYVGSNSINSNTHFQNHGVMVTSLNMSDKQHIIKADSLGNMLEESIVGQTMNKIDSIGGKIDATINSKGQDFPVGNWGMREAWRRVYGKDGESDDNADNVAKRIYALKSSNAIRSYKNGDIMSQIIGGFSKIFSVLGFLILFVLMAGATIVESIGSIIAKLVGSLNIFKYIYDGLSGRAATNDPIGRALQGFIDLWVDFKPIVLTIGTLVFMFMIVRLVMGTNGTRGKTFASGAMKYLGVFFAWGMLPFILGAIISYGTGISSKLEVVDTVKNNVQSTFYNAKAPFAAAFYPMNVEQLPSGFVNTNKGGIKSEDVYASWSNNADLHLSGDEWSAIMQWGSGDSFDADDVNSTLGWNGDPSDTTGNKGYFSSKVKFSDNKVEREDDQGQAWAASHQFLSQKLGSVNVDKKGSMPVVADDALKQAGFDDDLFTQTAGGKRQLLKAGSDRLRRLAMTHTIATWGLDSSGRMQVSRQTGMNSAPKVQWNSVTLVGDTFIARFANWSELVVQIAFTIMYAIIAYVGMIIILARTIGTALIDQFRATTGSVGAIARAILSALMTIVIMDYIAITVDMVPSMISAIDGLIREGVRGITGGTAVGNIGGQIVSILGLWVGGYLVIRLFMEMRGALMNGMTSFVNQVAEAIDRAMGIQAGADSSVSASMKRGSETSRKTMETGFRAMDNTRALQNKGTRMATNGLKRATDAGASALEAATPAAELAATAYAGPAAGKLAGMATKGAAGALKGASKGAKMVSKVTDADDIVADAGVAATGKAMRNNAIGAYSDARDDGDTKTNALTSAVKRGMATATGDHKDSGDINADGDVEHQNAFNQAVTKKDLANEMQDAKGAARKDRQLQRSIADKTALLTTQSNELTEALQNNGASSFAEAANGKYDNNTALEHAATNLQSAEERQASASAETATQKTLLKTSRNTLQEAKEEFENTRSSVQQQVASGAMSKADGNAAIAKARQGVTEAQTAVQTQQDKLNTALRTQRQASRSVTEAQGAVAHVQQAIAQHGGSATFEKPSDMASSETTNQRVQDLRREVARTQRDVKKMVSQSNTTGDTTVITSGASEGTIPTTGTTKVANVAGRNTSLSSSQRVTDAVTQQNKVQRNSHTTVDNQTTSGGDTQTVTSTGGHVSRPQVSQAPRATGSVTSSSTSQAVTDTNRVANKTRRTRQTSIVDDVESVDTTIRDAKTSVSNLEKSITDNRSRASSVRPSLGRAKAAVNKTSTERLYGRNARDLTDDTN